MVDRVQADGKHLRLADTRWLSKGVAYGSFLPRSDGARYPEPDRLRADLEAIAALGLNTVRTYDLPPVELFDTAAELDLRVLVGLDYRDWRDAPGPGRAIGREIARRGRSAVDELFDRLTDPGVVLAVSVGNEVPADLIRVHGRSSVEDALASIVDRVHELDPAMLATYTNFPTTEFLDVDGQDLITFNVFLEEDEPFDRYLRHLQVVSGPRPLVVTELGLAAEVAGAGRQAELLARQLDLVDRVGCAGATVFAWTDEWGVDGHPVTGWGFGITDVERRPKPAAPVVGDWASRPLKELAEWPRLSVVVCAYNEESTIEECLASLERCDYPDLEVLVCNDGSTDRTLELARRFPFTVLDLPHGGLSRARNAGIDAATGSIVAFLDADAACHPDWPWYLALAFEDPGVSAAGGPNLPVERAGLVERAVALCPGAPTEVLSGDDRAEHIAGCNMAFRRQAIAGVGAFDPTYTAAGDDVDACWKLLDAGHTIGFSPAAQVRHHRRGTVRGYLRQQRGYGRAEKLLSGAHPARFNRLGQARWFGVIYGGVGLLPSLLRPVVYHGHQGAAPFQPISANRSAAALSWATALLPLVAGAGLAALAGSVVAAGAGSVLAWWLAAVTALTLAAIAGFGAAVAASVPVDRREPTPARLRALVGLLHIAQPLVRTWGRLTTRRPAGERAGPPWTGDRLGWLTRLETDLRAAGLPVAHPGPTSRWDLEIRTGPLGRLLVATGVAWAWTPQLRTALRPRGRGLAATTVVPAIIIVLTTSPVAAGVVATLVLADLVVEAVRLGRARSIVARSTLGAEPGGTDG